MYEYFCSGSVHVYQKCNSRIYSMPSNAFNYLRISGIDDFNNNNNNIHLYSADSILICSSALYNSIKVGVCYVCMCMYAYVCVCMLVRYVYALKLI